MFTLLRPPLDWITICCSLPVPLSLKHYFILSKQKLQKPLVINIYLPVFIIIYNKLLGNSFKKFEHFLKEQFSDIQPEIRILPRAWWHTP